MRRRLLKEEKQGFQPYYSNYPVFTEYGKYILTPQTDDTTVSNTYIKLDDTSYNWAGGGGIDMILFIEYTESSFTVHENSFTGRIWIEKNQTSKIARIKRCSGTENSDALMEFYVEKVD